jgi:TM2 domain-containing membrane protein YozV
MNEILEFLAIIVALVWLVIGVAVFFFMAVKFIAEYNKYDSDRW